MILRAERVLLPERVLDDGVVEWDADRRVVDVRAARSGDPPPSGGWLVPGPVNAHVHLELSWAAARVPGGSGLAAWVQALRALGPPPPDRARQAAEEAAGGLAAAGVLVVSDVSNGGNTAALLVGAGLQGIVHHEVLGFGRERGSALAAAGAPLRAGGEGIAVRPSPHAVYSTAPDVLAAAAAPRDGVPATVHLGEDPDERTFLADGSGTFAALLDRFGVDWRWFSAPGLSPTGWLDALGVLGAGLLLVHGVDLSAEDRDLVARRGSPLCLCPRSNLHIGGRLPDVPALLAAGVRLCLGTDSLASSPTLDVLDEVHVLRSAFPEVGDETWLRMATEGGADALGRSDVGRFVVGARSGGVSVSFEGGGADA